MKHLSRRAFDLRTYAQSLRYIAAVLFGSLITVTILRSQEHPAVLPILAAAFACIWWAHNIEFNAEIVEDIAAKLNDETAPEKRLTLRNSLNHWESISMWKMLIQNSWF